MGDGHKNTCTPTEPHLIKMIFSSNEIRNGKRVMAFYCIVSRPWDCLIYCVVLHKRPRHDIYKLNEYGDQYIQKAPGLAVFVLCNIPLPGWLKNVIDLKSLCFARNKRTLSLTLALWYEFRYYTSYCTSIPRSAFGSYIRRHLWNLVVYMMARYKILMVRWYCRILSLSPMPCDKTWPKGLSRKKNEAEGRLSLLRPEGHVFHTAWETMIKSYYSTLADFFFAFYSHKYEF